MNPITYVAFLRGINVGGNTIIKMAELKKAFESLGFTYVVSVLASGNVVFATSKMDPAILRKKIEERLVKTFRVQVLVILRTGAQILNLIGSDPFKDTKVTPHTKLHVTFLANEVKEGSKLPHKVPTKEFQVVQVSAGEVCSAVEVSPKAGTPELMKLLEKEFGKNITTRTWNTIQKLGELVGG